MESFVLKNRILTYIIILYLIYKIYLDSKYDQRWSKIKIIQYKSYTIVGFCKHLINSLTSNCYIKDK